jgi:hypothetical protein
MLAPGDRKKSSNRLSGLFSKAPADTTEAKPKPPNSTESTGRLTKVRNRISSATHLAPDYPPPTPPVAPRHLSLTTPTIQPVETPDYLQPLEPPPALSGSASRNASPSGNGSRPGTPNEAPTEGSLKKLRRRSKMFGGAPAGDEGAGNTANSPLAWIAGHKGKVAYNLAYLTSGEQVSRAAVESELKREADM